MRRRADRERMLKRARQAQFYGPLRPDGPPHIYRVIEHHSPDEIQADIRNFVDYVVQYWGVAPGCDVVVELRDGAGASLWRGVPREIWLSAVRRDTNRPRRTWWWPETLERTPR